MKVICISDTHADGMGKLPAALYDALKTADLILHAGDITSPEVIEELKAIAPVEAVAGNMDGWDISNHYPEKKVIEAGGFRIGITHGAGRVTNIEERVLAIFEGDNVDCIVFGHSHHAVVKQHGRVLLVNPGSPTDKRWAPYNSYAVLELTDKISAEIVRL
jgi:putative phosphoesterase